MTDEQVAALGCIVCHFEFQVFSPTEVHHLRKDTGLALKSEKKIGLCALHHRLGGIGVAFHAGKAAFEANFGTQLELYEKMEKLLERRASSYPKR